MQNRIDRKFVELRAVGQSGFIAYITAGDPDLETTVEIAAALESAGVDLLELGVPFSDPLADGVANQLGAQRALAAGTNLPKVLKMVQEIRRHSEIPLVLYSYLNPVYQFGPDRFEQEAAGAGVDGVLLLDLPPDEMSVPEPHEVRLHRIRLVAPNTAKDRVKTIVERASGFIYYVSREGVTGERSDLSSTIAEQVEIVRSFTSLPVAVGFGISNAAQAAQVAVFADAVVVGSAIVRCIGEIGRGPALQTKIKELVEPIVKATHASRRS